MHYGFRLDSSFGFQKTRKFERAQIKRKQNGNLCLFPSNLIRLVHTFGKRCQRDAIENDAERIESRTPNDVNEQ